MSESNIILHISSVDDRLTVGAILLKNGYKVELASIPRLNRKTPEIVLRATKEDAKP